MATWNHPINRAKNVARIAAAVTAFALLASLTSSAQTAPVAASHSLADGTVAASVQVNPLPASPFLISVDLTDAAPEGQAHLQATYGFEQHYRPDDYWGNPSPEPHDPDHATGSLKAACLFDAGYHDWDGAYPTSRNWLTSADPWLTFSITSTAGAPTVHPGPGTGTAGPTGGSLAYLEVKAARTVLPCVIWRSAGTGSQVVTAHVNSNFYQGPITDGGTCAAGSYSGMVLPQGPVSACANAGSPVVIEWNTIDSTRLVQVTGTVVAENAPREYAGSLIYSEYGAILANGGAIQGTEAALIAWGLADPFGYPFADASNWVATAYTGCIRDRESVDSDNETWCGDYPNEDGRVVVVNGASVTAGPFAGGLIVEPVSFIEYALGSHPQYDGPVDGARQTFALSADSCGAMLIEDPRYGIVVPIAPGRSYTTFSSDKGVAFTLIGHVFNLFEESNLFEWDLTSRWDSARCGDGSVNTVTITTREDAQLRSDLDDAPSETVTVRYQADPVPAKQPLLAWAGQRVALEHDWRTPDGVCRERTVMYLRQNGPGSFVPVANSGPIILGQYAPGGATDGDTYIAPVSANFRSFDGVYSAIGGCISTAVYESQDPGEVDILAFEGYQDGLRMSFGPDPDAASVAFLIYFMKFESLSLGLVEGEHDQAAGLFAPRNPWNTATDTTSSTANVSADVLVRARVKGWFTNTNPTGRAAGEDANGGVLPAGRWVMPDDWRQLAGGDLADQFRPNYDIMVSPAGTYTCGTFGSDSDSDPDAPGVPNPLVCDSLDTSDTPPADITTEAKRKVRPFQFPVIGPFSLVDGPLGGDGSAANDLGGTRETYLRDGVIDMWDAPMPPALLRFTLSGAGFLRETSKFGVYDRNPFFYTNIPAEPWIFKNNARGGGYLWDGWASTGGNTGVYPFWANVDTSATPVYSAGGKDPAKTVPGEGKVPTGGYTTFTVYTDNHGEAMVYVTGDAGLTMDECSDPASLAANGILELEGDYCESGDRVGTSTITAAVDYPDFRKHYPIAAPNTVTVDWTWGGTIQLSLLADPEHAQFIYLVGTGTDRSGACQPSTSLHPLYWEVNIDQDVLTAGTIIDWVGNEESPGFPLPEGLEGECTLWLKFSSGLLGVTSVVIESITPEGTATYTRTLDFRPSVPVQLSFRWSLVTWPGADNLAVGTALSPVASEVTAVYGWNAAAQGWAAYFPGGVNIPGANDLTTLRTGAAYWVAVKGPSSVTWTVTPGETAPGFAPAFPF